MGGLCLDFLSVVGLCLSVCDLGVGGPRDK